MGGSLLEFMAIQSLNALVGNINRPGGVIIHEPLPRNPWHEIEPDGVTAAGLNRPRLDKAGSTAFPFSESLIHNFAAAVAEKSPSPVEVLMVFAANPAFTLPDAGSFRKALKKIPFIVSFSPYKDETAYWADLILPDHTALEKSTDVVWPTGLQYPLYGLSQPVVSPLYDTQHSGDVIIKIAKKTGGSVAKSFPWKNFEEAIQERVKALAQSPAGMTTCKTPAWKVFAESKEFATDYKSADDLWKKIKSGGLWYRPARSFKDCNGIFKTHSGRFEFFSLELYKAIRGAGEKAGGVLGLTVQGDEAFLPHYEPVLSGLGEKKIVMVPYGLINLSSGWLPSPPYLYKTLLDDQLLKSDSFAEINPETASKFGLREGDPVLIKSAGGELRARVHLFEGAMPGVIYMPLGFGHSAYDDFSEGKGVNPNEIIQVRKDPLSGQPIWWATNVTLTKA
jgi:anaerobic selenocysteine-containing dehydrogenase